MYLAKIYVTYKPSIVDPQGLVIKSALERLHFDGIEKVNQGKYFQIHLDGESEEAVSQTVEKIAETVLINHNTETFTYDIQQVEGDAQ
ncbi:phosphoribosylformylglycinamidine synthase subunit PurS [Eupransor demetentiae]|uniref:Phosphoribosylformylglycinamidine synthase subunit PurS n=1 Tax=Eupransor demetentiae TaxID=3109584 RepID=A0ABM9N408_9LACO|nr:Phosphoribosylformylglycinamidine (FGAM) synthase [Lactobacillaceae bacterium LMG 33000]